VAAGELNRSLRGRLMAREPHLFPPDDDPIEVWGRRIGRGLAVVAILVLAYYLFATYLR